MDLRQGKPAVKAQEFLAEVARSGDRLLLQLGMLADAGAENLALIRFVDVECVNTAGLRAKCQGFQHRIAMLFIDGGCKSCGYTQCAMEILQKPVSFVSGRRPYQPWP